MIQFSGLSRFSGLFDGDGPNPLNRNTTVLNSSWSTMLTMRGYATHRLYMGP